MRPLALQVRVTDVARPREAAFVGSLGRSATLLRDVRQTLLLAALSLARRPDPDASLARFSG